MLHPPPLTTAHRALAVFCSPPMTEAAGPLAVLLASSTDHGGCRWPCCSSPADRGEPPLAVLPRPH